MAILNVLQEEGALWASPLSDRRKGDSGKSRGISVEKKIEFLENMTGGVSNRRSRKWVNDRLLMELIPHLDVEEIRGLFAPPPWGVDRPLSPFCMTNVDEWDEFRNVDIDKEASMIEALEDASPKKKGCAYRNKVGLLNAWHRVDRQTRNILRRTSLHELIERYEDCLRAFIDESRDDILVLRVQDPFHRLLLHGTCQFYNLVSVTAVESESESSKVTKIKKAKGSGEVPKISLSHFLRMSKEGIW